MDAATRWWYAVGELSRTSTSGTVSAAEHGALLRRLAALGDQLEAVNEVLSAIGRSGGDTDTVLTTIVESACRLCGSDAAHLYLLEDGVYSLIKSVGLSEEAIALIRENRAEWLTSQQAK